MKTLAPRCIGSLAQSTSLCALITLTLLLGCSSGSTALDPVKTTPTVVLSVVIQPGALSLEPGASGPLAATVYSTTGTVLTDRTVVWSSENTSVASITSTGVVTALAVGSATIRASVEGKSGTAPVTVSQPAVSTVVLTPTTLSVAVGATGTLTASTRSASGAVLTGRTVAWTSSSNAIATVSQTGVVTGVAVGSATITAASEGKNQTAAVTVLSPPQAVFASIAPGGNHTCALDATGKAFCWGSNNNGVLGNASSSTNPHTPLPVSGGLTFTSIASGMYHSCALTAAGVAYCWGWNIKGQLGDGTNIDRDVPTVVNAALRFTSIAAGGQAGGEHSCALTAAGAAYCWGWNLSGQLGDGTNVDKSTPVAVGGGLSFASLSIGDLHSCALTAAGKAYCWGSAAEIGEGSAANRSAPTAVSGNFTFKSLSATWWSACGVTDADATYCWGYYNSINTGPTVPTVVTGFTFANTASSYGGSCGVTSAGAGYCWGINNQGQAGDGTAVTRTTAVAVSGAIVFAKIFAGYGHNCGLTGTGLAYCWGGNEPGQVGDGTQTNRLVPVAVRAPQ